MNTMPTIGFMANDDTPSTNLPQSDDELVIAYSMVAALYQLVLRWSQNGIYDDRAQLIAESAERLLLRTDVMRRVLWIAGLERRQEFATDHIALLEEKNRQLLKALQPFAQLVEPVGNEPDSKSQPGNMLTQADFTKARVTYNMLKDDKKVAHSRHSHPC